MQLNEGEIYHVPAWGNSVFCGISQATQMLVFRRLHDTKNKCMLLAEYSHTVRKPTEEFRRLEASCLHNDKRRLLRENDYLFFKGVNGIQHGKVKKLHRNSCDLKGRPHNKGSAF